MSVGYQLKKFCEQHGVAKTLQLFNEGLATRKINPYQIRLPELARHFLGEDQYSAERKVKAAGLNQTHLLEASEAVDASAFANITGQLLVTIIKEKYNAPEFIGDRLMRTIPNPGGNLKEHKIPYLSDVKDDPKLLAQAEPYPHTSFAESWVTMPAPEKRGLVCSVTMEMLFSDLTGQAQDSAASVGRRLRYQKEERQLRVVLGLSNPYVWNGNALTTYVSTAGTGNYVNKLLSSTITNYTHVAAVEKLFWQMEDPITGKRILARPTGILCMPEKRYEMKRILNATEVRSGDITTGTGEQTISGNPLDNPYELLTSPIAQALLDDETALTADQIKQYLIFADFQKAFFYREVYPLKTDIAPPMNPMEFSQDIVLAVKASEFGVPGVYDPRYAVESTSEAA